MSTTTIDGCRFDPDQPRLRVSTPTSRVVLNCEVASMSPGMRDDLREVIGKLLTQKRPELVYRVLSQTRVLARHAAARQGGPIDAFCLEDFETFRRLQDGSSQHLAALALDCLRDLDGADFRGLTADLRRELPMMRVPFPPRASPGRMACPRNGPLKQTELSAVSAALREARAAGHVTTSNYALCMLALAMAPRPGQLALLKVGDLLASADGVPQEVTMPIIKLRRRSAPPRRAPARRLHRELAEAMGAQRADAIARGERRGMAPDDCPLFFMSPRRTLVEWPQLPWNSGHSSGAAIGARIIKTFAALDLSAVRAKAEERRITPTRLRRSLASCARSAGCSFEQIGILLWHSGSASASIYTGPSVGLIERVERAVDFKPLAALYRRALEVAAS